MKLIKSFTLLSLSSLLAFNVAYAEAKHTKPHAKTEITKPQSLAYFNNNVGLQFLSHSVDKDQQGKPRVLLHYKVTNKGKSALKSIGWLGAYTYEGKLIFAQNVDVAFSPILEEKETINLDVSIPFSSLPEIAQKLFSDPNADIRTLSGAKYLQFKDGKKFTIQ